MVNQNLGKMKVSSTLGIVAFLFILFGCSSIPVYEKVYVFENNKWDQSVKPQFIVNVEDTSKMYDFTITLRTTTDYMYSNLWIYLNSQTPDKQHSREPFEIKITDANGEWVGKKTGSIVEHTIYFTKRKLPVKGKYVFIIEQGITESIVDQVLDIGMVVTESKTN